MGGTRHTLLVIDAHGSVVRAVDHPTKDAAMFSRHRPDLAELLAGCRSEVRSDGAVDPRPLDEPVNPKVVELVRALFDAGIPTFCSGDLYGDRVVYVDLLEAEWGRIARSALLPHGWAARNDREVRETLGLPPWRGGPRDDDYRRLLREGTRPVTPEQAREVVGALLAKRASVRRTPP